MDTSTRNNMLQKSSRTITRNDFPIYNDEVIDPLHCDQRSPFSNAFIHGQGVREMPTLNEYQLNDDSLSFPNLGFHTFQDENLNWTKKRYRPSTDHSEATTIMTSTISKDKALLSRCQFIAQLDDKFLVIHYDGALCLIDQHAADERIGLEQLQGALHSVLRGKDPKDASIQLSKFGTIPLSDILKSKQLDKSIHVDITAAQRQTIVTHEALLRTWKFDFYFSETYDKMRLKSVPEFCGKKQATVNDFIHFVDELSDPLCLVPVMQSEPIFVQRYLSSLACRYGVMFGETLSEDRCRDIIASLTQCDMPFVCAHGRPSLVSLLDQKDDRWQRDIPYFRRKNKTLHK